MGMRFRKSFKLAPGVRVNLGKKSMGVSFGNKYGGVSINSKSGIRGRTSIPGTGISFSETAHSGNKTNHNTSGSHGKSDALSSLQFLIFALTISIIGLGLFFFNYMLPGAIAFVVGIILLLVSYFNQ